MSREIRWAVQNFRASVMLLITLKISKQIVSIFISHVSKMVLLFFCFSLVIYISCAASQDRETNKLGILHRKNKTLQKKTFFFGDKVSRFIETSLDTWAEHLAKFCDKQQKMGSERRVWFPKYRREPSFTPSSADGEACKFKWDFVSKATNRVAINLPAVHEWIVVERQKRIIAKSKSKVRFHYHIFVFARCASIRCDSSQGEAKTFFFEKAIEKQVVIIKTKFMRMPDENAIN